LGRLEGGLGPLNPWLIFIAEEQGVSIAGKARESPRRGFGELLAGGFDPSGPRENL
jgi:hypothetical protein